MVRSSRSASTSTARPTRNNAMAQLAARVRAALAHAPCVEEKTMFGGIAFMVRHKMCICVGKGRLMCRIDPEQHARLLERKNCRTVVMKGRPLRGYVNVDAVEVGSARELAFWVKQSLDYNATIA